MANSTLLVDYLGQGTAAGRPAAPSTATGTLTFYYSNDTLVLSYYDWNAAAWVNVSGGGGGGTAGLVWLATFTGAAVATIDCTGFVSSTYDVYKFVLTNFTLATSGADLEMRIGTGGGPTYDTGTNYEWINRGIDTGGGVNAGAGSSVAFNKVFPAMSNNANFPAQCEFTWHGFNSTATRKNYHGTFIFVNSTPLCIGGYLAGDWLTTGTAVTAVRFLTSSGNIATGTVMVYGQKK